MPVPKYRTSRSKKNMRRSHEALSPVNGGICPNCKAIKLPHRVCSSCGFYKNEQVLEKKDTGASNATTFNTED